MRGFQDQELLKRVKNVQAEFSYDPTLLSGGIEVWRCHQQNTNVYSFELVSTQHGLYMSGDIGSLVWDARQLSFLAGRDVDYYIYSKLAQEYRESVELDRESYEEWIKKEFEERGTMSLDEFHDGMSAGSLQEALDFAYGIRGEIPNIQKPTWSIMFRLYMSCYAAREITKIESARRKGKHEQGTGARVSAPTAELSRTDTRQNIGS